MRTLVASLTMVTFITKVINMYMVSMVALVPWLFYLLHNVQTGSGTRLASYYTGTEVAIRGQSGRGVMLPTHLHLAPSYASTTPTASKACAVTSPFYIFLIVPMVTNITIDFLVTMITLGTRVSNVLMLTYAFRVTMITNITIDLLATMMTLVT